MNDAMHALLTGAAVGVAAGILLYLVEYVLMLGAAKERFKRTRKGAELSDIERRRLASVARFCLILPFAFAAGFWVVWS